MKKSPRRMQFEQHLEEIRAEYEKKLSALYILYPEYSPSSVSNSGGESTRGNLTKIIRQAIEVHQDTKFTLITMAEWIFESNPTEAQTMKKSQLSNTLARLAKMGEIETISEDGKRPIQYRTKKPTERKLTAVG